METTYAYIAQNEFVRILLQQAPPKLTKTVSKSLTYYE